MPAGTAHIGLVKPGQRQDVGQMNVPAHHQVGACARTSVAGRPRVRAAGRARPRRTATRDGLMDHHHAQLLRKCARQALAPHARPAPRTLLHSYGGASRVVFTPITSRSAEECTGSNSSPKASGVPRVGSKKPGAKCKQRDVVVTGNGQYRSTEPIQERARIRGTDDCRARWVMSPDATRDRPLPEGQRRTALRPRAPARCRSGYRRSGAGHSCAVALGAGRTPIVGSVLRLQQYKGVASTRMSRGARISS